MSQLIDEFLSTLESGLEEDFGVERIEPPDGASGSFALELDGYYVLSVCEPQGSGEPIVEIAKTEFDELEMEYCEAMVPLSQATVEWVKSVT